MKSRKKTFFTLAVAVILAAVGAVAVLTMTPRTKNTAFQDILQGKADFLYVSEETIEAKNIYDVPALFDPYDSYMKIWDFAMQDLDGDENAEVILYVCGAAGDMGGSLILHQIDDKVYGYAANNRTLTQLKTDGTFQYSDPTGMHEAGIGSIAAFTKTGYTLDKITCGQGAHEGWDTYIVNRQSATEEEYHAAMNEQAGKSDVTRYDFTTENIKLGFQ